MRKSVYWAGPLISFIFLLYFSTTTFSAEASGEELFNTMKCTMCHDAKTKKRGPSLMVIAATYPDTDSLFLYFNGKSEPIVEPKRAKTMKPRLRKIMKLDDADKKALASYLFGFKKTP